MDFKQAEKIIEVYNNGTASAEERILVESWYLKHKTGNTLSSVALQEEHDLGLQALNAYLTEPRKSVYGPVLQVLQPYYW